MTRLLLLRRSVLALVVALLAALLAPGQLSAAQAKGTLPYQDPRVPVDKRVDDLLGRLTLDEKLSLLHQSQVAIPRLGIPYFKAGTEALHGVAWSNDINDHWNQKLADKATVFPQAVGLASTWNPGLIKKVGSAVGDEARAYNSIDPDLWGLQLWAPVVNLLRDPRWGRNEEGYSEDPHLTSAIATSYGKGLQGDHPTYLKTAPVLKHFYAYNNETNRSGSSSNVTPRVRREYDYAAFKPSIEADAATGVMASYNMVNARPTHVDREINEAVRSWTDKTLYNVTDAWGPHAVTQAQFYYDTEDEAYANVLKAGNDSFTVDNQDNAPMKATLKTALDKGLLTVADIDKAVRHTLTIRTRLGHFDPDGGPYAKIKPDVLNSAAHKKLNRQAADEATVLLRNSEGTLPLDPAKTKKVAVVGPLQDTLFTDWYGAKLPYEVTPLDGIKERLGAGADVTGVDAIDRVAFKDNATGKYLTATGTTAENNVAAIDTSSTPASQWDVTDWMADVSTLRNVGNKKLLTGNFGPFNTTSDNPTGWYVQQQFAQEKQGDGSYLLRYEGYETNEGWWSLGDYVTVAADGTVGIGSKAQAARFTRDVVSSGIDAAVEAATGADAAVVVVGSNPFVYGRENHDRTSTALSASQQALIEAVQKANPKTVVVLEDSYPTTMDKQPKSLLWTTHAGSETGHAVADTVFGDYNPSGRLTQTWYRSDADLQPNLFNYDIINSEQTYLYSTKAPLYAFGHGLSYSAFRYSNLRTSRPSLDAKGRVEVTVDVTNTGKRAGDEVVQLYTHQRTSRDKTAIKSLRAFDKVRLDPGQKKKVKLTLKGADLAHWDVTRNKSAVESSDYDLLVGASSSDIRARAVLPVRGEKIPPRDLTKPTQAENFDAYRGIDLVDTSKERGTSVASTAGSSWVSYSEARFGPGPKTFTAKVAKAEAGAGSIQVRLGSPTGKLIGSASVTSTGNTYSYASSTVKLGPAGGNQDVYLVLSPGLRLASFTIR